MKAMRTIHNISMRLLKNIWPRSLLGLMLLSTSLWLAPLAQASTLFGEILRASDTSPQNAYGFSVSVSGDTAAIGAWFGDGAVYIMQLDPDTGAWRETQKIETPEIAAGKANFGFSIWLDGDQLVVGAPNILLSSPGAVAGFAFFYQRDAADGTWRLVKEIEGEAAGPGDFPPQGLGREVAVDQGLAAISRSDDGNEVVLTYELDPLSGAWVQNDTLAFDVQESWDIGNDSTNITAITLDNKRLAVGVKTTDSNDISKFVIQLFDYNNELGAWVESGRLDEFASLPAGDNFRGLVLDDHRLVVTGSEGEGPSLFLYDTETAQWSRDVNFSNDVNAAGLADILTFDLEGSRLVLEGESGGAIVYERNAATGRWAETLQLSTALLGTDPPTVTSVDLEGDHILVGVPYIDGFTGAVLAYRLDDLDSDGVFAADDNCPDDFNPTQDNFDSDLLGDVCDLDDDNDGVKDNNDGFPLDPDRQDTPVNTGAGEAPGAPHPVWPFGSAIALESDFRWSAVPNATYYVIEVRHNDSIRAYEPTIMASTACLASQCWYIKSDAVLNGANRWRLRAGNDAGVSEWSPWVDFFVGQPVGGGIPFNDPAFAEIPALPDPQLPFGNSSNAVTDYVWSPVPGALQYAIEVRHEGSIRAYEPSIPAAEACLSSQCSYTKSDAALVGANRWRVRAINDIGPSEWSDWVNFGVSRVADDPSAPSGAFIPGAPAPAWPVNQTGNQLVDYRWSEVTGATMYAIEIQHMEIIRGYDDNLLAAEICTGDGCIYGKPDAARPGENRWRVRAGNSNGFSVWSEWQFFTIQ